MTGALAKSKTFGTVAGEFTAKGRTRGLAACCWPKRNGCPAPLLPIYGGARSGRFRLTASLSPV